MPPTNDNQPLWLEPALQHLMAQRMAKTQSGVDRIKQHCKKLLAYGVKEITFEYDGSGDSGDLSGAWALISPDRDKVDASMATSPVVNQDKLRDLTRDQNIPWDQFTAARRKEKDPLVTAEMCDEIADAAFELLPGGWEINDGSYGTVTVDTAAETIEVEHNERYTEVRTETFNY